ncbi:MAG: RHS repeat-associated core domain-containing protein [Pseudohongiella sp.]|nr:RHS repeat-associated core domain-containing protein [Pseudohongiella sp.]
MAATVTEGASTLTYTYDAEHQRVKQSDGSSTIRYLNDPVSGASAEYHTGSGGVWHDYFTVQGERIGKRTRALSPASITHQRYVQDHLGSVALVLNSSGTLIQKLSYDAWGLRRYPSGAVDATGSITSPVSRGYTDHEHLPGSRLINMNARMYDPELGRFLSADPFVPSPLRSQAYNRYSYVYNNPLRYTDPSGYNPNCPGCPVIIVTPEGNGQGWDWGSGWRGFEGPFSWDWRIEIDHWALADGGFVDGSTSNSASIHYKVSIAVTTPTLVQQNRSLNSNAPAPTFESVVTARRGSDERVNPYSRIEYPGPDGTQNSLINRNQNGLVDGLNGPNISSVGGSLEGGGQSFLGVVGVSGSRGVSFDSTFEACWVQTACFQIGLGAFAGAGVSGGFSASSEGLSSGSFEVWGFFGNGGVGVFSAGGSVLFGNGTFSGAKSFFGPGAGVNAGLQFCKITVDC